MESSSTCADDDILCIAEELLSRWEPAAEVSEPESAEEDCIPCLIANWDPEFED